MSKILKKRNWRARQIVETKIDDRATKKIKLDLPEGKNPDSYDDCNALVLPSTKRKTTKHIKNQKPVKLLSRKQRKKLELVVARKAKKINRSEILEALSLVGASKEEMDDGIYIATANMQKKATRKEMKMLKHLERQGVSDIAKSVQALGKIKSVRGCNRKKAIADQIEDLTEPAEDSSSSDSESEPDDVVEQNGNEQHEEKEERTGGEQLEIDQQKCADNAAASADEQEQSSAEIPNPFLETRPKAFRPVARSSEIQDLRAELPIFSEEQGIMDMINSNPISIICGETGSGKTTQVPQFLYEAGYTSNKQMIAITEPRRVAAITMSQRVGYEMGMGPRLVSYQIRYEGNAGPETELKFMTDGVLLKEIQNDFLLTRYSVVIIDEAHERSVFTDILIGLLSRIVPLRNKRNNPLRLIIMSATLRVEDFTANRRLFPTIPPVFKVDSRQFPVSVHFNRKTPDDYVMEAFKKICKIHRKLPSGGILVFVTGQQEVNILCRKLGKTFPFGPKKNDADNEKPDGDDEPEIIKKRRSKKQTPQAKAKAKKNGAVPAPSEHVLPDIDLNNYSVNPIDEDDCLEEMDHDSDIGDLPSEDDDDVDDSVEVVRKNEQPMYVLPLYSMLPPARQARVFQPPPDGCRLCVVSTNVAETSLTIPHVKYIVDTGKVKSRCYDSITGVSAFRVTWTSKAAANQRAGRAGRTGPGHCYRLYSSAVFNDDFMKFTPPEICRKPIDDLILQLKVMNIEKVLNFPFPTPVSADSIKASERRLSLLGALEKPTELRKCKELDDLEFSSKITPLGHAMACFPVAPKFGKMLALSHQFNLLPYVICSVAALSVQEVLCETYSRVSSADQVDDFKKKKEYWMQIRRTWAGQGESLCLGDVMVLLKAVGAAEYADATPEFCELHGLRHKAVAEIRKLRVQLTSSVNEVLRSANLWVDPKLVPPTDGQARQLRQILLSGMPGSIARKVPDCEMKKDDEDKQKWRRSYRTMHLEDLVYIHPSSILFREQPEYIVYQEIVETTKMYMRGVSAIEPEWLMTYCASQCTYSKPREEPPPFYNPSTGTVKCVVSATFGRCGWTLPETVLDYPQGLERIQWFARFLLDGKIFPKLATFTSDLLSPPSTMTKSWAKLQPRTETLMSSLLSQNVDCKSALSDAWSRNPTYLLRQYMEWLPESSHGELSSMWPPL